MASSSRTWRYNVFVSFHGPDVRKSFLSHVRRQFKENGITMFYDEEIERGQIITPELIQAIRGSRISILILSKKYASSSWCLDELLEILECKKAIGQIVMTIFYGVDPSAVMDQTGEFGMAFNETCDGKTEEERRRWSQALNDAANIAGEDFKKCDNEAERIEKIAKDVSEKLNATPSRDFDGMVGLEAPLREIESLLRLRENLDATPSMIVGICGPAGIGKSTIARALHILHSNRFQLTCFVDNLRESYPRVRDEYVLKLHLQSELLLKILNLKGITIGHLGVLQERLHNQRVLIILDDVKNIMQLEALANEPTWFGPGSRIVVTTENKELLKQHGINNTYHVDFPSDIEAIEILCKYAFKQSYPRNGFKELAKRVTELCGNLPLGLRVVGSSLCRKNEDEWEEAICNLETIRIHQGIEEVLRVGFESLHEHEQNLFLHIAIFFNHNDGDLVKAMFSDSNNNLVIKHWLKTLVDKSLISISTKGEIVMHKLLQQMGTNVVHKEEPWKRRILIDASDICAVLEDEHFVGARQVSGILFDTSGINKLLIRKGAFERMTNLWYLSVHKSKDDGNDRMHIPEGMEFPRCLRLLDWKAYPSKCLPSTFHPEYLVEFNMPNSKLEKLWEGTQPLKFLKKMDLEGSSYLKELPDLSNATNLETLELSYCESLVEIPPSFSHLHKLQKLKMTYCINLQVIPVDMNLASLETVNMEECSRLRNFPVMSTNIEVLDISKTAIEDVPASIMLCSRLVHLFIRDNRKLKGVTHLPTNVQWVDLSKSNIEKMPDCMKALHQLDQLDIYGCRRLTSLPELPGSLNNLRADNCKSLKTIFSHLKNTPDAMLHFINCFNLDQQARREIIRGSLLFHGSALLPGNVIPSEFDHRASGNSLTIPYSASTRFKVCLVIKPYHQTREYSVSHILCCRILRDGLYPTDKEFYIGDVSEYRREHLFIFHSRLLHEYIDHSKVRRNIVLVFTSQSRVIECGAKIWTGDIIEDDVEFDPSEAVEDHTEYGDFTNEVICDENLQGAKHTYCWSWLFLCFDSLRNIHNDVAGRSG